MKRLGIISGIVLLSLFFLPGLPARPVLSELDACPQIVNVALEATGQICDGTGRNEACYGHVQVEARAYPDAGSFRFDQAGDRVGLTDLQSLRLSKMDTIGGTWGVALLRLQANLPRAVPDRNVTLLIFGDVEIENTAPDVALRDVSVVQTASNVNVRQQPALNAAVIGKLAPDQVVTATGRLADHSWVRVLLPEGNTGWMDASLLQGDISALDVVEASAPYFGPMQAFYLASGMNDALCPEAPSSGILVQTPEGVAEVTLLVNEVNIQLGSTVYFQARAGDNMVVRVVEGHAHVTAQNVTETAYAGSEITVPLDADGKPAGPPNPPVGYAMSMVSALPVGLLERPVVVHPPLTPDEITALAAPDNVSSDTTLSFYETVGQENPSNPGVPPGQVGPGGSPGVPAGDGTSGGGTNTGGSINTTTDGGSGDDGGDQAGDDGGDEGDGGDHKVTICHKGKTIEVDEDAVAAHLAHGDTLGPCS